VGGVVAYALISRPGYPSDFYQFWAAARTLLAGGDPYLVVPEGPLNPFNDPAKYPLPAYLLLCAVAWMPLGVAGGVFMAISTGLCVWGIARTGIERLPLVLSASFLLSLSLGQWSPLLVAAALLPWLSPVIVAKPNLAVGVWAARPLVWTALGALALIVVSLVILPAWPREWLANLSSREEKFIPALRPGGIALALAALALRRPEGRLLLGMSIVPQALLFYDQLLLWLIPRTLRQALVLSIASLVLFLGWRRSLEPGDFEVQLAVPYAFTVYLVALTILLWNWRRDRHAAALPDDAGGPVPETAGPATTIARA
jgi:hypothetical protein